MRKARSKATFNLAEAGRGVRPQGAHMKHVGFNFQRRVGAYEVCQLECHVKTKSYKIVTNWLQNNYNLVTNYYKKDILNT